MQPESSLKKRSVMIGGRRTAITIEDVFWDGLKQMALDGKERVCDVLDRIEGERTHLNMSSAVRIAVFQHHRKAS